MSSILQVVTVLGKPEKLNWKGSAFISVFFLKKTMRTADILASLTVIAVKAVSSMIALSVKGKMQLTYSVFYIMSVLMATSCAFQIKFLNRAMHLYEATAVVPINFVFVTTSAIISGVIFYREFQSAALLSVFMFLFGCLLSSLGVIITARNKKEEHLQIPFIDCGHIPVSEFGQAQSKNQIVTAPKK
ncbi:hypothetical protein DUI87_07291 [Hirundo rustica rustica]|uniref:NIPA-like protein 2 n=1 Tax=Hirundo rustica rustica TaxID=333673 RepID=A0A3M0KWF8_HIRRU|nr:hypothetical protein DUI87_07291 [Hirundo rustica rustica]